MRYDVSGGHYDAGERVLLGHAVDMPADFSFAGWNEDLYRLRRSVTASSDTKEDGRYLTTLAGVPALKAITESAETKRLALIVIRLP